ncbi:amino acid adenylation domain-containing protein [Candidatus Uabimicrobium sp. HlEnr_7]|uniref:amino acid adenylation domain-containing protein n=1 Tax=Candidatus Uabimicrobium helgolandensis TaxID=3095367 RepID=UPI003558D242
MSKKKQNYSKEFKSQIVRELLSEEMSLSEICKKHKLKNNTVLLWKSEFFQRMFQDEATVLSEPKIDNEYHRILVEFNDTKTNYLRNKTIQQLFEEQVEKTPENTAAIFGKEAISYRQLNYRINQLARYLMSLGVGPEVLVGICIERSIEMIVGLLGILKAGGAYVPFDPEYPQQRLAYIIEDTKSSIVLTQKNLLSKFSSYGIKCVCLDEDWSEIAKKKGNNVENIAGPENLVYVIYTSGSTGKPKGVMSLSQGIINRIEWMQRVYPFKKEEIACQKTVLSFVDHVAEIFLPLLNGVPLVIISTEQAKDVDLLIKCLVQYHITRIVLVPSLLRVLLQNKQIEKLNKLTFVYCSGEILTLSLAQLFHKKLPNARLLNIYGSTEVHADATYYEVNQNLTTIGYDNRDQKFMRKQTVPIGKPIDNTQIYILNDNLEPLPIGISGELYIGGVGVAKGYLNQQQLTKTKFIANPYKSGKRVYKTGDLARWLPDGNIEFMGRSDDQVKIRGFRIEIGEIETALLEHNAISNVVVVVRENIPQNKQLVAYIVYQENQKMSLSKLRLSLKEKLPEYMIPSYFIKLDKLPLTINGKVDRKALPIPDSSRISEQKYIPPRNEVEIKLVSMWQEVLRVKKIGIMDNFFELGGHSLLATQLISRVKETFTIEMSLRSLFAAPRISELAILIKDSKKKCADAISVVNRNDSLYLSSAQKRMWFFNQLTPNSPVYNLPQSFLLRGRLRLEILQKSFNEIIRRHESLRTTFHKIEGRPTQVITAGQPIVINIEDFCQLSQQEKWEKAKISIEQHVLCPFDLSQGPLIRINLFKLGEEEHILLINMHHIVSDGWSLGIFMDEFKIFYEAFSKGENFPLADLQIQYTDFAYWQQNKLQGEIADKQIEYWKHNLANAPPLLNLPTDYPRPKIQKYQGIHENFIIDKELTDSLRNLSKNCSTTIFMTLLAGFKVLLYRYTNEKNICVGSPIANRNHLEIENLIGFFVNTLVLRTQIEQEMTFRQLLLQIKETCLAAYDNQDVPFEKLVNAIQPQRDMSYNPLFQVMFAMENITQQTLQIEGLIVEPFEIDHKVAKFDISINLVETAGGMQGILQYNIDLFEQKTIKRMITHFYQILKAIASSPDILLDDIDILNPQQRNQLLMEFNNTQVRYPQHKTIHQLFEEQVEKTPNNIAIIFEDEKITYHQLNQRANQLAHYLISLGVESNVLVGICIERSIHMIVGLLGVLKAGGAYVPLDPDYPQQRLAYMIKDTNISLLLTEKSLPIHFSVDIVKCIYIDTNCQEIYREKVNNVTTGVRPENFSYVIYTSGSTGKPKGVIGNHKSSVNYFCSLIKHRFVDSEDTVLQIPSLSFDPSIRDICTPLLVGAKIVLLPTSRAKDSSYILTKITQHKISKILSIVPTLLDNILKAALRYGLESNIQKIYVSGEKLEIATCALAAKVFAKKDVLVNIYGPTECTMTSTYYPVDVTNFSEEKIHSIPIGKPMDNVLLYVLNKKNKLCPIGVPGELHIGGVGVVSGYLNQKKLTTKKFITNPYKTGERIYKTGDLVRWLPDGNIEFLGRLDHQVKVRGFRIELGEIETVLLEHEIVKKVVVLAKEDTKSKFLVAYIVSDENQNFASSTLRLWMKEKLPQYMIPAHFVIMEKFPLNPNGKIDRKALLVQDILTAEKKYIAPRNEIEKRLVKIWEDVLDIDKIGINDNFFEVGGHSLTAVEIISKIREIFEIELPLKELFEKQTIKELVFGIQYDAKHIDHIIKKVGNKEHYPCSEEQNHLYLLTSIFPEGTLSNSRIIIPINDAIEINNIASILQKIVERHEILRTNFFLNNKGKLRQKIEEQWEVKLIYKDYSNKSYNDFINEFNCYFPKFDLEKPPIEFRLFTFSAKRHLITVDLHHVLIDWFSINQFKNEFDCLYKTSKLPEQKWQYKDYVYYQKNLLESKEQKISETFWFNQFRKIPELLNLPTDYPRPNIKTYKGKHVRFEIENSKELADFCKQQGLTMYMVLLGAFSLTLSKLSNQEDIVVGSFLNGRNKTELQQIMGLFVKILCIRIKPREDKMLWEYLHDCKEVVLGCFAHQNYPYSSLVNKLKIERTQNRNPLFDVLFSLMIEENNTEDLSEFESNEPDSWFDLTLLGVKFSNKINFQLIYDPSLFKEKTIRYIIRYFTECVAAITRSRNQTIGTLSKSINSILQIEKQHELRKKLGFPDSTFIFPLTDQQKGLWFEYKFNSNSYNNYSVQKVEGNLDIEKYKNSMKSTANFFDSLRTLFIENAEGEIFQVITPPVEKVNFEYIDIYSQNQSLEVSKLELKAKKLIEEKSKHTLNLSKKVYQVYCIKFDSNLYFFLHLIHHIVNDAKSALLCLKSISTAYNEGAQNLHQRFPKNENVGFYLQKINEIPQSRKDEVLRYWEKILNKRSLKNNFGLAKKNVFEMKEIKFEFEKTIGKEIKRFCKRHTTTPFLFLTSAFAAIINLYWQIEDLVIGYPIDNRPKGYPDMYGFYVSMLPLRIILKSSDTFLTVVKKVTRQRKNDISYQDISQIDLAHLMQKEGFSDYINFDIIVGQALFKNNLALENLKTYSIEVGNAQPNQNLGFLFEPIRFRNESLTCKIQYNNSLFSQKHITQFIQHFQIFVHEILENPNQRIGTIDLLSPKEKNQLLIKFNNTKVEYPRDKTIHQLFEEQVQRTPDNIALIFENTKMTYQELNTKANQVAKLLRKKGVKTETFVGVCLERSLNMIVALFAILKTSGAYVPFDNELPQQRLQFLQQDANVDLIISSSNLKHLWENNSSVLYWEDIERQIKPLNKENLNIPMKTNNAMYMIYTSGSTGRPKGVVNIHRALINRLSWMQNQYAIDETGVVLQKTTIGFDVSVWEIFWPLLNGAKLVLARPQGHKDPQYLSQVIEKYMVTTLHFVPSMLQTFLQSIPLKQYKHLQRVICSGEALSLNLQRQFLVALPHIELYNLYGPTEAAIEVTSWKCNREAQTVLIGKPIQNIQIYILNKYLQAIPCGCIGELYIGGVGLARNYHLRPKITAEKFVPNPFTPGERLYRTGDLARYIENGNIEFIGRRDNQVKIHGFRIELGEIEHCLSKHEKIAEVAVVVKNVVEEQQLVAYVVLVNENNQIEELRSWLKEQLPYYMIPNHFVVLDKIPLTPNDKIDRKSLPTPKMFTTSYVAPRNENEKKLVALWQDILHLEQVGITDNFFKIGGHSLNSAIIVAQINELFSLNIPLKTLYEAPTIAKLTVEIFQKPKSRNIDWSQEILLDSQILIPKTIKEIDKIENILLTGATGFLGTFLLERLIEKGYAKIYCLVRAKNKEEGYRRVESALQKYLIWKPHYREKITIVCGDLSKTMLGLTQREFNRLSSIIDVIYHNGAKVDFIRDYQELKAANVQGTKYILQMACQDKIKTIHYISTVSVWKTAALSPIKEIAVPNEHQLTRGYAQSKWVAEQLIEVAKKRGFPINIYRPGRLTGHSQTGVCNENDLFYSFLRGCIQLKAAPQINFTTDLTPINYASSIIANLSYNTSTDNQIFHVINPNRVSVRDIFQYVQQKSYPIEFLPYPNWRKKLYTVIKNGETNPLSPFLDMFGVNFEMGSTIHFDCSNAVQKNTFEKIPEYKDLLSIYLEFITTCSS